MKEQRHADDPAAIERDLEQTRARVDRTIDEIQERLSPGQLLDEGLRYFRQGPGDFLSAFGNNLGHSVRDNPLPVAMIGLGVAWLALGQQGGPSEPRAARRHRHHDHDDDHQKESLADRARAAAERIKRQTSETEEAFEHRRHQVMARALELEERAGESLSELKERVTSGLHEASVRWEGMTESFRRRRHDLRDQAGRGMTYARDTMGDSWESAGRTSSRVVEMFEQKPLLAAAAGITAGAILGCLLPSTRQEREALGPHRDALLRQGEEVVHQAMDTARHAGQAAAEAALGEVERVVDEKEEENRSDASNSSSPAGGSPSPADTSSSLTGTSPSPTGTAGTSSTPSIESHRQQHDTRPSPDMPAPAVHRSPH